MWEIKEVNIKELKTAEYNPRKATKKGKEGFKTVKNKYGIVEPIVLNKDLTIIGGHQRVQLLLQDGETTVQAFVATKQLTDKKEKELNVLLNSATGYTDVKKLLDLKIDSETLKSIGFREFTLPKLKLPDQAVVKSGIKANQKIVTLFLEVDEYATLLSALTKIKQENQIGNNSDAFAFLINFAYELENK